MKYIKLFESFLDEDPIWIIVSHIEDHNIREIKIDNFPFKIYELGDIPKKSEMDNLRVHMKESGFFFERNEKYIVVTDDEKIGQFNMFLLDLLIDYLIDNKIEIEEPVKKYYGEVTSYRIDLKKSELLKYFGFWNDRTNIISEHNPSPEIRVFIDRYLRKKYNRDFIKDGIYYYKIFH